MNIMNCGLFVYPLYPYLAATPDGLINSDSIVEIKCPFLGRNFQVKPGKFFPFLEESSGQVSLKPSHNYYYQIQGQLGISQRKFCYFVVYTHVDLFVQKIPFNSSFFSTELLPKLSKFYNEVYCPLISRTL